MKITLLFLLLYLLTFSLQAQWMQVGGDFMGDEEANELGTSVSISGDGSRIAIGAPFHDGNGNFSGQVIIYDESGGEWFQVGDDLYGDAPYNNFGFSVSLSADGKYLAVGASGDSDNGQNAGQARVFRDSLNTWIQIGEAIKGQEAEELFGWTASISSDGSRVAIGAPETDNNSGSKSGHIRVYDNNEGSWEQVGSDINGKLQGAHIGRNISLSDDGQRVALGTGYIPKDQPYHGYVQVYEEKGGTWNQVGEDLDWDNFYDDCHGSVALSGNGHRLAVGLGGGIMTPESQAGKVKVLVDSNGTWKQTGNDLVGEKDGISFGWNPDFTPNGKYVSVTSLGGDANGMYTGRVRVFKETNGQWNQVGQNIEGDTAREYSGSSVSISSDGSRIAIGAPQNSEQGIYQGEARVFEYSPVAVDEADRIESLDLYPNPTSGHVSLDLGDIYSSIDIIVRSISGERVGTFSYVYRRAVDLNINGPSGVYFLDVVLDGNQSGSVRIVKQ